MITYIYTYVCVMNRLYSVDNEIKWLFRANFSPVCMVYGADVLRCQNYWALNADVPENCTCLLDGFDDSILVCFSKMVRTTLIYILYLPFRSILQPQRNPTTGSIPDPMKFCPRPCQDCGRPCYACYASGRSMKGLCGTGHFKMGWAEYLGKRPILIDDLPI